MPILRRMGHLVFVCFCSSQYVFCFERRDSEGSVMCTKCHERRLISWYLDPLILCPLQPVHSPCTPPASSCTWFGAVPSLWVYRLCVAHSVFTKLVRQVYCVTIPFALRKHHRQLHTPTRSECFHRQGQGWCRVVRYEYEKRPFFGSCLSTRTSYS